MIDNLPDSPDGVYVSVSEAKMRKVFRLGWPFRIWLPFEITVAHYLLEAEKRNIQTYLVAHTAKQMREAKGLLRFISTTCESVSSQVCLVPKICVRVWEDANKLVSLNGLAPEQAYRVLQKLSQVGEE